MNDRDVELLQDVEGKREALVAGVEKLRRSAVETIDPREKLRCHPRAIANGWRSALPALLGQRPALPHTAIGSRRNWLSYSKVNRTPLSMTPAAMA